jgi:hypothetical protein
LHKSRKWDWTHVITTLVESHSYDVIFVPVGTNVMEEISFHHKCVVKSAKWDERQSLKCCRKKKNDTQKNEWNNASDISQWWRTINIINGQHKGPMLPNHGFGFTPKLSFVKWVTFLESIAWKQELDILPIVWLVMPIDATSDTGHICYTYYHFWNIS